MASKNQDPAAVRAPATSHKGAEPGAAMALGSVGKRLQQELMTLMMSGDKGISAFPESDNLFKWVGTILGAAGTVYEDLKTSGKLCMMSGPSCYQSLLGEPNIDSPLNTHAAELWTNPTAFKKYLLETYLKQVTSQEP
ncbi:ubiquitin-conjugating enzyme E2 C-like [Petaurus breviceps papuanus]|uniref:ubiquitin-conjugating enzyme E2 C-like n=1 Tax=Petaurus breviceps papuanus TaxID=3040969 RepID=UPI0036DBF338